MSDKYIISIILLYTVFVLFVPRISSRKVFGPILPEEKLDLYFEKYWDKYADNGVNDTKNIFYGDIDVPYIAKHSEGLFGTAKWYIEDNGRISKKSKWSKELDMLMESKSPREKQTKIDYLLNK